MGILVSLLLIKVVFSGFYLQLAPWAVSKPGLALAEEEPTHNAPPLTEEMLNQRAAELEEREKLLKKREEELLPLKKEVDEKLAELNELQESLTSYAKELADREQALQDAKMNHLVSLYSSMEPARAATIMEKLNLETVVRILANMKGKSAGKILAMMDPEKGAAISEKLTRPNAL